MWTRETKAEGPAKLNISTCSRNVPMTIVSYYRTAQSGLQYNRYEVFHTPEYMSTAVRLSFRSLTSKIAIRVIFQNLPVEGDIHFYSYVAYHKHTQHRQTMVNSSKRMRMATCTPRQRC